METEYQITAYDPADAAYAAWERQAIIEDAEVACPCGETGHPREYCDPAYLAEVDALLVGDRPVPDGPPGQCWTCRRLAEHGLGPHSDFARRVRAVLTGL